ncbi:unnamed protein product [Ceratitis capitata]|uniref:(Mediterranean fruit fly) hypothetical protein n=1 Tax=Ceratitis capitata TaxID=7213 RepID=A0A811UQX3_CERCA|nr:unnamed protein product [Ceratitis capitata]
MHVPLAVFSRHNTTAAKCEKRYSRLECMSYPYSVVKLKGCDYNKINIEAGDGKVQQQKQNAGLSFQLTITEQQVATNPEKQLQQLNHRHFF